MRWIRSLVTCALAGTLISLSVADFASAQKFVPKSRGIPGRREGGGTRGDCTDHARKLTAIVPQETGETISEYPTFSWSLPATQATSAEFLLIDPSTNTEIYKTSFPVTGQAGIISIAIPKETNVRPLALNKDYKWQFAVVCDRPDSSLESMGDSSNNATTEGLIRRVPSSAQLQQQLKNQSPAEQAAIYAREGLWFDAAQIYTQLQRQQPGDRTVQQAWRVFLESVELNTVAQEPLLPLLPAAPTPVAIQKAMK